MITYDTNWMGPIANRWYTDRGLDPMNPEHHYAGGRIDIRGVEDEPWGLEYGLRPMKAISWRKLSDWLMGLKTEELLGRKELLERFEKETGHKIEWWEDE